jgi:hypothetical protein
MLRLQLETGPLDRETLSQPSFTSAISAVVKIKLCIVVVIIPHLALIKISLLLCLSRRAGEWKNPAGWSMASAPANPLRAQGTHHPMLVTTLSLTVICYHQRRIAYLACRTRTRDKR